MRWLHKALAVIVLWCCAGCDRLDMYDQPRYKPLAPSAFFGDGLSARAQVAGTIARGELRDDEAYFTGKEDGKYVLAIPEAAYQTVHARDPRHFTAAFAETDRAALRRALLERGKERFEIHCAPCHARTGDGNGMIVRRGFRKPPAYHVERLQNAASGYFFDVMTHGFGAMASVSTRVETADRWAIVAYIRALQLSQHAKIDDVPDAEREELLNAETLAPVVTPAEREPAP